MFNDKPTRLRYLEFSFEKGDDEMGFMDEEVGLGRGVRFEVGEQCGECRQWVDNCECPKADCGCVHEECQCGLKKGENDETTE